MQAAYVSYERRELLNQMYYCSVIWTCLLFSVIQIIILMSAYGGNVRSSLRHNDQPFQGAALGCVSRFPVNWPLSGG